MAFFFKNSKKGGPGSNALPPASRDIRSSDGPSSQIPTLNGVVANGVKSASPTPGTSVNNSLNSLSEREPRSQSRSAEDRLANLREDGTRGAGSPGPEQKSLREQPRDTTQRLPLQTRPPLQDPSPYPWSQRRLTLSTPQANVFPRYGAAVNASAGKDGSVYMMGGLINGSTVKGDLWMVDTSSSNLACFPVMTTSEGPGPRVGHASLLVGNAFIVFGGDTKMDEGDTLDDTLYLLNTSTKQWSRALPAGPRPSGRYGHTLNILGSKIYVFGGQVEGYFFNDLVAFDLNALQHSSNRWETLIPNTIDGGPPHGQIPPARTNHTMITWGDRLFLFGGTDGLQWFNDVWSYSPHTNSWTQLECIGYIPSAREGHAAALVGDVMYIFGGRNEEGNDLGDLAAFRISSRRWYTFQNMGPSPSARSGHSMTTVGKQIVVLAGEPSSAPRDPVELGLAYFLDTSKIRYPPDASPQTSIANDRIQGHRRPSGDRQPSGHPRGQNSRDLAERERSGSIEGRMRSPDLASRLPRAQGQMPAPSGPPPQTPGQQRAVGVQPAARQPTRPQDRAFSPSSETDRQQRYETTAPPPTTEAARITPISREVRMPTSSSMDSESTFYDAQQQLDTPRQKPETYQPSQDQSGDALARVTPQSQTPSVPDAAAIEETPRQSEELPEPMPHVRKISVDTVERLQDSGIGSSPALTQQYDEITRELELVKQRNAWYASELALAKKSGYQSRAVDSPVLDERVDEVFSDDDRPLVEALLRMRAELIRVQAVIDEQSKTTAERVAAIEKERDAAITEAVFAKTKLAGSGDVRAEGDVSNDRSSELSRRLASSLEAQTELSRRIDGLIIELEAEKQARVLAEDTANAAQKRVTELDSYRQQHSSEVEGLRSELHETQREARSLSAQHADISASHQLLTVDKSEMSKKLEKALVDTRSHSSTMMSLQQAIAASGETARVLQEKLDEERSYRESIEQELGDLRSQHDSRVVELDSASKRLRDAEEIAQKHAEEARIHRDAVLAGLSQASSDRDADTASANDERIAILQQQVETANSVVQQNKTAADMASEKLRRAEERIAGLEAYQEQASREGLTIRKQLQAAMRENQSLAAEKSDLAQRMERHMLNTNALSVQHASLKDVLGERGISTADMRRSRALESPSSRFSTPDIQRVRELEQQLEASIKGHDEIKAQFEDVSARDEKMKREYEDKLTALDSDHQAAVKYLRGTEKMLSKMKQELLRVKNENTEFKKRLEKVRDDGESGATSRSGTAASAREEEKEQLRRELAEVQDKLKASVTELESRLITMQGQLQTSEAELLQSKNSHANAQHDLAALHATHSQTRTDMDRLRKENAHLDERARDAENKVQLLLDQVEHSVDNYRRQSRMSIIGGGGGSGPGFSGPGMSGLNGGGPNGPTSTNFTSSSSSHVRNTSETSDSLDPLSTTTTTSSKPLLSHHIRNISTGGDSIYSTAGTDSGANGGGGGDERNSLALDSLASELETLRTHWETTKNSRLSDRFDFMDRSASGTTTTNTARNSATANVNAGAGGAGGSHSSVGDWRRGLDLRPEDLDLDEDLDEDDERVKKQKRVGNGNGDRDVLLGAGTGASLKSEGLS